MGDLETVMTAATTHVPRERAQEWFELVCEAIEAGAQDWDAVVSGVTTRAADLGFPIEGAERFREVMESDVFDKGAVLAEMLERRDELATLYQQILDEQAETSDGGEAVEHWYEEETGLYVDAAGNRYQRDGAGEDHVLQAAEGGLWWVSVDGEDYWYNGDLTPYSVAESESDDGGERFYDEATALYVDAAGNRYWRDSAGEDHPLQAAEDGMWWLSVDGADYWYNEDFTPYVAGDEAAGDEAESDGEAVDEAETKAAMQAATGAGVEAATAAVADDEPSALAPLDESDLTKPEAEAVEKIADDVVAAVDDAIGIQIKALAEEFGVPVEEVLQLYTDHIETTDIIEQAVQDAVEQVS